MWLALIGMSGIGKSYWSEVLARNDFLRFDCDQLITQALGQALGLPINSFADFDRWIGLPTDPSYDQRNAIYAAHETAVMEQIIASLETTDPRTTPRVVIDTSGSLIYVPTPILERLHQLVHVVHLASPPDVLATLVPAFLAKPRPVIWNGLFQPLPAEPLEATYRRCYPQLVAQRNERYEHYADLEIPFDVQRQPHLSASAFLDLVRNRSMLV